MNRSVEHDEALANLIGALAEQYRKQLSLQESPVHDIRLDVVRKLMLIADSVKGLMKHRQLDIEL